MRLCTIVLDGREAAAIAVPERGVVPLSAVDPEAPADLLGVLEQGVDTTWAARAGELDDGVFLDGRPSAGPRCTAGPASCGASASITATTPTTCRHRTRRRPPRS